MQGPAEVRLAPGLVHLPATVSHLSADGCLIELQKPQRLSQDTIVELTFTVNDLPFREWGRLTAIRSDTTIGFHFPILSQRVRGRLACLLEQLIEDFITGDSPRCAGEQRRFPRIHCKGAASVQIASGETLFPAIFMDLSAGGCLIALKESRSLSHDALVELKLQINHLPFRVRGQAKGIRSATSAGFSFPLLSETGRMQLEDLLAELLKDLITRLSKCTDLD
jgi:hypothetical protein